MTPWLDGKTLNISRTGVLFQIPSAFVDLDTKTIYLSQPFINMSSPEAIVDMILHELAHLQAPDDPGHREKWILAARKLGVKDDLDLSDEYLKLVSLYQDLHICDEWLK